MTYSDLRQGHFVIFPEESEIEIYINFLGKYYKVKLADVYQRNKNKPVTIEMNTEYDPTITELSTMLGKRIENAIDQNTRELTNIAYNGQQENY